MKWFSVMDMHSGGGRKTPFEIYFVETADEADAESRFESETGECIHSIACEYCGPNFSLSGGNDTLAECAAFWAERRGGVEEYLKDPRNRVKVIYANQETF